MSNIFSPVQFVLAIADNASEETLLKGLTAGLGDGVRVLDVVVVSRGVAGDLGFAEFENPYIEFRGEGIVSDEDALHFAASLPAGTTALLIALEAVWAASLHDAAAELGADLVVADYIPPAVVMATAAVAQENGN